jgi:predicted dithiol-disulfide oxidoreductase (DUF899 family)
LQPLSFWNFLTYRAKVVVTPSEWRSARLSLLEKEKEHTRINDALAAERRSLPMVEITKDYVFTTLDKSDKEISVGLSELFAGRRQLIIYHFMFDPSWDAGCPSCSLAGDSFNALEHLNSRDTTLVCVSRAPIAKIAAYKKRMGWTFPWVSSYGTDFNYDFHVTLNGDITPVEYNYRNEEQLKERGLIYATKGEQPGYSCFVKGNGKDIGELGKIYHTYSCYARSVEKAVGFFGLLDITLLGRGDKGNTLPVPTRRDEYTPEMLKGTV